jgi:hypothetical protein
MLGPFGLAAFKHSRSQLTRYTTVGRTRKHQCGELLAVSYLKASVHGLLQYGVRFAASRAALVRADKRVDIGIARPQLKRILRRHKKSIPSVGLAAILELNEKPS